MRHYTAVEVHVTNRLVMPRDLPEELVTALKATSEHSNPAYHKAKAMGFWSTEPKLLQTWANDRGVLSLPRGRTNEVRAILSEAGIDFEFVDDRERGKREWANQFPSSCVELWSHQQDIVDAIGNQDQGLVRAPTGSGKTTAAIAAIAASQLPTIVLVWTSGLVDQWVERIHAELGIPTDDIGIIGGGKEKWAPITVSMQQSLARSKPKLNKAKKLFGSLVCDEVQKFAAGTFLDVVDKFPAAMRIGFSADERRKDEKQQLIYDMFGRVMVDVDRKELEKKELVLPVLVRVIPTEFDAPWYTQRRYDIDLDKPENPNFTQLLAELTTNNERNAMIMKLLDGGLARMPTLALTHRREHALLIRAKMTAAGRNCGLLVGSKENAAEFASSVKGMRSGQLDLGVGTYQAIGQGLDIKPAAIAVCTTPIHANKQFFGQVRGRICRSSPGKTKAELFYFWDKKVFGVEALHKLARYNDRKVVVLSDGQWIPVDTFIERWRG